MELTHTETQIKTARTQLCAIPDLHRIPLTAEEQAWERGIEEGTKIGQRLGILLAKGYSMPRAIEVQSQLIFFRRLKLPALAGYLKRQRLLGVGTEASQIIKLQILGFEETVFGSVLHVDWDVVKRKKPHHLFLLKHLLVMSREYAPIEAGFSMDEILTKFCRVEYDQIDLDLDEEAIDEVVCSMTLGAIRRVLCDVEDVLSETLPETFDAMLGEINLPSLLKESLDQLNLYQ